MIIGIPGNLGHGKSATMAMMAQHFSSMCSVCSGVINPDKVIKMDFVDDIPAHLCTCETPKPHKIHSNFWLNLPNVHYVTCLEDLDKIYDGYAFLDELWTWIDSRVSGHSDTNLIVTGILHKSRKRGYNIIYESKLIHMTDRRLRELTDYIIAPNKYICSEGELIKVDQNILYPINLEPYIDDTWFIIDMINEDGTIILQSNMFQFPLNSVIGLYDTKEEIINLANGEKSPGLEKGMKIETNFTKAIKEILPDSEIQQGKLSRGWDIILKANGHSAAFDVVSVNKPAKGRKDPWIDLRCKHIKDLLKTAHKSNLRPFWAYYSNGKWLTMPMLESHAVKSTLSCRDAKELKEILC